MESLTLPGELDSLEPAGEHILEIAENAGLDLKAAYRLRLAVDELITNIITYGYEANRLKGNITLITSQTSQAFVVVIEDTAPSFDPRSKTLPDVTLPPEQREVGGLGIYLVLRSVDELNYEHFGGRNRTTLKVYFKSKKSTNR